MRTRSVALAVAWRNLHNFFTNPALVVPALLFPLFFFTAFAGGLSRVASAPGFDFPDGYTAFQFVFVLLQASAFGGVFTGFAIARDFESGFGRRMMLAAPNRLGDPRRATRWRRSSARCSSGSMLTVIALAVGMEIGGDAVDLVGLYVLGGLPQLRGADVGGRHRAALPLDPGRPADADARLHDHLPGAGVRADRPAHGWVETVANVNPITAIVEAGRDLISGGVAARAAGLRRGVGPDALLFGVWAVTRPAPRRGRAADRLPPADPG